MHGRGRFWRATDVAPELVPGDGGGRVGGDVFPEWFRRRPRGLPPAEAGNKSIDGRDSGGASFLLWGEPGRRSWGWFFGFLGWVFWGCGLGFGFAVWVLRLRFGFWVWGLDSGFGVWCLGFGVLFLVWGWVFGVGVGGLLIWFGAGLFEVVSLGVLGCLFPGGGVGGSGGLGFWTWTWRVGLRASGHGVCRRAYL